MAVIEGIDGDGTQDSPYEINTVQDFLSVSSRTGYAVLKKDLDFNNYNGGIIENKIVINCDIDGDGHVIRNINDTRDKTKINNVDDQVLFDLSGVIRNTKFESLNADSVDLFMMWNVNDKEGREHLINCNISCRCKKFARMKAHILHNIAIKKCSISIIGIKNDALADFDRAKEYIHYYYCDIKEHIDSSSPVVFDASEYPHFHYCRVDVDNIAPSTIQQQTITICSEYSVFLFRFKDGYDSSHIQANFGETSVFDSTLLKYADTTSSLSKGLTTADMKSAKKLQAAGFPVIEQK